MEMYLLTNDKSAGRVAMDALADALPTRVGSLHEVQLGQRHLLWRRAQMRDNLHVFPNGVVIGRLTASEPLSDQPVIHHGDVPRRLPPLLPAVIFRESGGVVVEPVGITSAFVHGGCVSDRQLLLAAAAGLQPSGEGVALLAGLGYFPGNTTLFAEMTRIPFLERWYVDEARGERTRVLPAPRFDDAALVERLVSLVPTDVPHAIGLTGGHDSRFVLGVLRRAGVDVRVVRFADKESAIVDRIAAELGLSVDTIGEFGGDDAVRTPYEFTLMSDAQIWHGVAQYGRLRQCLSPQEWFHNGQMADSLMKNMMNTAWKVPDPRTPYWRRLLHWGFFGNGVVPSVQPAIKTLSGREELAEYLEGQIKYQRDYVELSTRKQLANWIFYMNVGQRWAQAYYDELSFSSNLVYLAGDVDAHLMGIAAPAWKGFHFHRGDRLTHSMLPEVSTSFVDGAPATPPRGPRGVVDKVDYEYLKRYRIQRTGRANLARIPTTYAESLPEIEPSGYDRLFDRPMEEVATLGGFGLRRANVTISNVLTFLASVRPDSSP